MYTSMHVCYTCTSNTFCKCCQSSRTCTCIYVCVCWYDLQAGHAPMHRACSLGCTHSLAALLHHEANLSCLPPSNRHTLTHSEVHVPYVCVRCTCVHVYGRLYTCIHISACKEVSATELPLALFCGNYIEV